MMHQKRIKTRKTVGTRLYRVRHSWNRGPRVIGDQSRTRCNRVPTGFRALQAFVSCLRHFFRNSWSQWGVIWPLPCFVYYRFQGGIERLIGFIGLVIG